jgi:hypothetical protein
VSRNANQVVPLTAALGSALPLTGLLLAVAVVLATVQRLSGPVWLPAAFAAAAWLASAGWYALPRAHRVTPIEPLPEGADVLPPRTSARRRALKTAYALPLVVFLGGVHRHTEVSDLALTLAVPGLYGWVAAHTWLLSRRVSRSEASIGRTLFAAAGPFEGCGGRARVFVAAAGPRTGAGLPA